MKSVAFSLAALLLLAGASSAQSFNVDVGTFNAVPSAAYGAAAAQPGTWNQINPTFLGTPQALTDVNGAPTAATLTLISGGNFDFYFDNVATTGDDALLMDDCQDAAFTGGSSTWTFSNLAAGTYTLTTYAWAPDSDFFICSVSCGTVDPPQNCGGTWPGTHALGITHAVHHDTVAAGGSISVTISTVASFSSVNGFQLTGDTNTPTTPFCLGDGTGAPCPCTPIPNNGSPGRGCGSAAFPGGALLTSSGVASDETGVGTTDTFELTATDVPGPTLFIQSNGLVSPIAFGDGQLCAFTNLVRLGVVFPGPPNNPANVAKYPGGTTPNEIHIQGLASAGQTKHYQAWYRSVPGVCTPGSNYDLTQGLSVVWGP